MRLLHLIIDFLRVNAGSLTANALIALLIMLVAWVTGRLAGLAVLRALRGSRAEPIARLVRRITISIVVGLGALMALDQLGIDIKALLAAAGVVGLALSFGAQNLVRDVISGFFLMLEGTLLPGDRAEIAGKQGTVEEVGLRVTRLRSDNDQLWYIRNGEITLVGNLSRGTRMRPAAAAAPPELHGASAQPH